MFVFDKSSYLSKVALTPNEYYRGLTQASIYEQWENTTVLYSVKEQQAYPFVDSYSEYEAWVSAISDDLINYNKVYSDFLELLFKDIDHKQNYKGQYYKIALDGEHEETYLCYDTINTMLNVVATTKVVRCNNVLRWIDDKGTLIELPCYLGTDISSTNNLVNKDGIVPNARMVIMVQANEDTKKIVKNQRFLFEHSTAFKVEQINNFAQEEGTEGEVTCIRLYVDYSAVLPSDNLDLNICDYYANMWGVTIDQGNEINQVQGFEGTLTATVTLNMKETDDPVEWSTVDSETVSIDSQGNYQVKGKSGSMGEIRCSMTNNKEVYDTIIIKVVDSVETDKEIIVTPTVDLLDEMDTISFEAYVYSNGEKLLDEVTCVPNNIPTKYYSLESNGHSFTLTNNLHYSEPLILTFSATDCEDVTMSIVLNGLL